VKLDYAKKRREKLLKQQLQAKELTNRTFPGKMGMREKEEREHLLAVRRSKKRTYLDEPEWEGGREKRDEGESCQEPVGQ